MSCYCTLNVRDVVCSIRKFYFNCRLLGDEIWIADYDLECNSEDELSLKRGEMIYVVEKSESGWWKGRCDDGRAGWFPASYLRAPTSQEVQEKKKVYRLPCFCSYVCTQSCLQTEAMFV